MARKGKWPPEDIVREVKLLQKRLDQTVRSQRGSQWDTWNPTWTADTTNPSLGDGYLEGRYARTGYLVNIRMLLRIGSTTTMGSGAWQFTLPFSVVSFTDTPGVVLEAGTMSAIARDESSGLRYTGSVYLTDDNHMWRTVFGQGVDGASATSPFTWDVNDVMMISGFFETDE